MELVCNQKGMEGELVESDNVHWTLPTTDMIKVNTGAAIFKASNCYSYSFVARNHTDELGEARSR